MNTVYVKVEAEYAKGTHGGTWVELEDGEHFMHRLSYDELLTLMQAGLPSVYIESATGEIVAKPFENLGLFGAQPEPALRFTKARIDAVAE